MNSAGWVTCPVCGAATEPGGAFCSDCGAALSPASSSGTLALLQDPAFWEKVRRRARRQVAALCLAAIMAFLDYRLHREPVVSIFVGLATATLMLFFREARSWVIRKLGLHLPRWAMPAFATVPVAFYFFARGRGTLSSGTGFIITLVIGGLPLLLNKLAPQFDPALSGFYRFRDQAVPSVARPLVMAGLGVLITFGLIHGNLGDVKVLWGETASKAQTPSSGSVLLSTLLNMVVGFLILHSPPAQTRTQ